MRNGTLERTLRVMLALRERRRTLHELAQDFGVHPRTIRRDIYSLEAAQVPIRHGEFEGAEHVGYWWIDREFEL